MRLSGAIESIRVGLGALRIHPGRTLLSTLGVLIGTMALTATFAVIDGVDEFARRTITQQTSVQDVVVTPRTADPNLEERLHFHPTLTLDDLSAARTEIPQLVDASLTVSGSTVVGYRGQRRRSTLVLATANVPTLEDVTIQAGRFYTDGEVTHNLPVIVLGHRLAEELAQPADPLALLGRDVRVQGLSFNVVGVLAARPGEREYVAFGPLSLGADVTRYLGVDAASRPPMLRLKAASLDDVTAVRDATVEWLATRFGRARAAFDITIGLERIQRVGESILLTKLIFGLLVALTLTVGGVGIMNVMLASVAERTREIGIRKAVGASGREIQLQFLTESVVISAAGAMAGLLIGIPLAIGSAAVFRSFTHADMHAVFTWSTVAMVAASALAVGTIFGTYPSRRAARLAPIDAISRE